jgi:hypothetical protein
MKLPVVDLSAQEIDESVRSDVISLRLLMTVTAFGVVAFVNSGDVTAKAMLGLAPGTARDYPSGRANCSPLVAAHPSLDQMASNMFSAICDPGIDSKIELST